MEDKEPDAVKRRKKRQEIRSGLSLSDIAGSVLVVVSFLDILAWNIAALSGQSAFRWLETHDHYARILRLDQRWNMYAPAPRRDHGWLVVLADLSNGAQVDLFTGQTISWDKPRDIGAYFGDDRWRRYLSNLFDDRDPALLREYADYLVRNWNQTHEEPEKVQAVTIIFMRQETQPDLTVTPPEKDVLFFCTY